MEETQNENGKMEKEADKHPNEYEYSDADLNEMGECLIKAQKIQSDKKLYSMVKDYLDGKVNDINSLDDLRRKQKEVEMRDNEMEDAYNNEN